MYCSEGGGADDEDAPSVLWHVPYSDRNGWQPAPRLPARARRWRSLVWKEPASTAYALIAVTIEFWNEYACDSLNCTHNSQFSRVENSSSPSKMKNVWLAASCGTFTKKKNARTHYLMDFHIIGILVWSCGVKLRFNVAVRWESVDRRSSILPSMRSQRFHSTHTNSHIYIKLLWFNAEKNADIRFCSFDID